MIDVKLSIRGAGRNLNLSQFLGNEENRCGDVRFHVNDGCERADVWFVIEGTDDDDRLCRVPAANVYFLSAETSWPPGHYAESPARMSYLRQFSGVFTCHDVYLDTVVYGLPFLPWMINSNHGASMLAPHERDIRHLRNLDHIDKTRNLSVFCSAQEWTAPHRLRLRFVEKLKEHFGNDLDWFGNGIQSVPEKWDGLAPYKYTVVLENQSAPNIVTEKIQDAYLSLSYPIYWGAPNITDYFDGAALTTIDIKDLSGSIATIERLLHADNYDNALPHLRSARQSVLTDLHFLERMSRIAREAVFKGVGLPAIPISISSESELELEARAQGNSIVKKTGRFVERAGRRLQR